MNAQSYHPSSRVVAIFHLLSLLIPSANGVLYNDGQTHSIQTSLNDAITLRSSSKLTLPPGDYTIRSPSVESDSDGGAAIRLYMSSSLNATGGDVIGADASKDHPVPAAGVIVGGASRAVFYEGVTVRGGSHLGAAATADGYDNLVHDSSLRNSISTNVDEGQGGDALISQYIGSNVTIHGGNFLAGRGSIKDGHSLHASYEAQIHIHGGTYYGSWMARDQGSIVVNGCLSRIGTRLVGRLQNGHSLDVQLFEEGGGKIIVNSAERCNQYKKKEASPSSPAASKSIQYSLFLGMAILLCFSFVLV